MTPLCAWKLQYCNQGGIGEEGAWILSRGVAGGQMGRNGDVPRMLWVATNTVTVTCTADATVQESLWKFPLLLLHLQVTTTSLLSTTPLNPCLIPPQIRPRHPPLSGFPGLHILSICFISIIGNSLFSLLFQNFPCFCCCFLFCYMLLEPAESNAILVPQQEKKRCISRN